jgi:hypothetical protein
MQYMAVVESVLEARDLTKQFLFLEMGLIPSVAEMQFYGIRVNKAWFPQPILDLQQRMMLLQELLESVAGGRSLNLNSPNDIQDLLYRHLHLKPPHGWVPKGRRAKAEDEEGLPVGPTSTEDLEALASSHGAVSAVVEWRRLFAALSLLKELVQHIQPHYLLGSHRIRPKVDTLGTATGRLILSSPRLQQILHEIAMPRHPRPSLHEELSHDPGCIGPALHSAQPVQDSVVEVSVMRASGEGWRGCGRGRKEPSLWMPQTGILRAVTPRCLGDAYQVSSGAENVQNEASSLADYWRGKGFMYSPGQETQIRQVLVELQPGGNTLTYPADKVFRRPELTEEDAAAALAATAAAPVCLLKPRDAFRAAKGCRLVSADYAQMEMRMLAHHCGDARLCQAFRSEQDVFRTLAAEWKAIPPERVTVEERNAAKQMAYAILYGQGSRALAKQLGIARGDADQMQESFMKAYPGIIAYAREVKEKCKKVGGSPVRWNAEKMGRDRSPEVLKLVCRAVRTPP